MPSNPLDISFGLEPGAVNYTVPVAPTTISWSDITSIPMPPASGRFVGPVDVRTPGDIEFDTWCNAYNQGQTPLSHLIHNTANFEFHCPISNLRVNSERVTQIIIRDTNLIEPFVAPVVNESLVQSTMETYALWECVNCDITHDELPIGEDRDSNYHCAECESNDEEPCWEMFEHVSRTRDGIPTQLNAVTSERERYIYYMMPTSIADLPAQDEFYAQVYPHVPVSVRGYWNLEGMWVSHANGPYYRLVDFSMNRYDVLHYAIEETQRKRMNRDRGTVMGKTSGFSKWVSKQ